MAALPDRLLPGRPYPLGATWDGLGTNFAVFSAHARRIDLCLFDPSGRREIARLTLPESHGQSLDLPVAGETTVISVQSVVRFLTTSGLGHLVSGQR